MFLIFHFYLPFLKFKYPPHGRADHFWWTRCHVQCDWTISEVQRAFPDRLWGIRDYHSVSEWPRWFQFYPESRFPHSLSWWVYSCNNRFHGLILGPDIITYSRPVFQSILNKTREVYHEWEQDLKQCAVAQSNIFYFSVSVSCRGRAKWHLPSPPPNCVRLEQLVPLFPCEK